MRRPERAIENTVGRFARERGVLTPKLVSPSNAGFPDRLYIFPGGVTVFIEFKAPGGKLSAIQAERIADLLDRDHRVRVIDSVEAGKALVRAVLDSIADA